MEENIRRYGGRNKEKILTGTDQNVYSKEIVLKSYSKNKSYIYVHTYTLLSYLNLKD